MNCKPDQYDIYGFTALMYAFGTICQRANFDHSILHKLLDMNCLPKKINIYGHTALMYAFSSYSKNPDRDPKIFLKLIMLIYPSITQSKLILLLDKNTRDNDLKRNIIKVYLYDRRRTIINSRRSKRRPMGKRDSLIYL
jgi:hypothetical protein